MLLETLMFEEGRWSMPLPTGLDSDRTCVLAFCASSFGPSSAAIRELRAAFPRSHVLGCSTAGGIRQDRVYDEAMVVSVARFDATTLRTFVAPLGPDAGSFAAGRAVAQELASPGLRALFVLSEGLHVNGSELARGLGSGASPSIAVTGGLAADGDRFQSTWVFDGKEIAPDRVAAIGLYGDRVSVTHGSRGGWDIFGLERRVTRSKGNVLYELDGKPALRLYKEYLGDRASGLPATALLFPLAMRLERHDAKQLVRTVLSIDESDQSMTFAGDVPEGSLVQLMRANFDRLVQGASDAAALARAAVSHGQPLLSIAISCVGRRLVLGERTEEELEATLDVLPAETRQIGFYSYGELSPYASGDCDLHNQTMTLTTIAEP